MATFSSNLVAFLLETRTVWKARGKWVRKQLRDGVTIERNSNTYCMEGKGRGGAGERQRHPRRKKFKHVLYGRQGTSGSRERNSHMYCMEGKGQVVGVETLTRKNLPFA